MKTLRYIIMKAGLSALLLIVMLPAAAQHHAKAKQKQVTEPDTMLIDSARIMGLTKNGQPLAIKSDSSHQHKHRDWATWKPEPKRALWLALVLPGAGQIYNRKYWKLPIFYGGFVGCAYALQWNNMMYRDYSQAYLDIMDNDPTTESYNKFLHLGSTITPENEDKWKEVFRKRKDRYRRWRDMSVFVMIGIYGLSVVDAYVDASLSQFDISPNLSLRVSPAVITNDTGNSLLALRQSGIGLRCAINF